MSKYLKQVSTGRCFAFADRLAERADMVPWTGPLPFAKVEPAVAEKPVDEEIAEAAKERMEAIVAVIKTIDPEEFGQAPGRLAAPKVAAVSDRIGYKVSAAEIQTAMVLIGE